MDVWIIRDGEKVGPIHDFEIRRQIEAGELPATTPAWHEGLSTWKPIIEIELFTREFQLVTGPPSIPFNATTDDVGSATKSPAQTSHYGRRFWARWLDLSMYSGLWWLAMWAARQDIEGTLMNPWLMFLQYVPWFAFEAFLIHRFATTPGKWLLGLQVTNKNDTYLDLGAATRRSLRVLFSGIGFGWSILSIFCQALSLFTAKRLSETLWDHTGGHQVTASRLRPFRVVTLIVLFAAALHLQMIVISPALFKLAGERYPSFKAEYEKNPPWHLPQRSASPGP